MHNSLYILCTARYIRVMLAEMLRVCPAIGAAYIPNNSYPA